MTATLPAQMVAGVPAPLVVNVSDRNWTVPGAVITVTAVGGSALGGSTDNNGRLESPALIDANAQLLSRHCSSRPGWTARWWANSR